jgi:hypothetical protein
MGFILLILFESSTFSIYVDTHAECIELGELNQSYWQQSGQSAKVICMKSFEV